MKKLLSRVAIILGSVGVLVIAFYTYVTFAFSHTLTKTAKGIEKALIEIKESKSSSDSTSIITKDSL